MIVAALHCAFISISGSLQYSVLIIKVGLLPIVVFIITTGSLNIPEFIPVIDSL